MHKCIQAQDEKHLSVCVQCDAHTHTHTHINMHKRIQAHNHADVRNHIHRLTVNGSHIATTGCS